jgi:hypothetical protein
VPIDPRELARFRHHQPGFITNDWLCGKCGYNLKGLRSGGVCPECGTPMGRADSARLRDNLSDAPLFYLRRIEGGLLLMILGSVGGAVVLYLLSISQLKALLLIMAACTWWLGVFIVTAPRVSGPNAARDMFLESPRLRMINRSVQAAWIVVGIGWLGIAQQAAWFQTGFIIMAAVLPIVGLLGLIPLSAHLSSLADWAGHTALGDRFRATAWVLAACGIVATLGIAIGLLIPVLAGFLTLAVSAAILLVGLAQLAFLIWLLQLSLTVEAAISSAKFSHEREQRRLQRLKEGEAERHCPSCRYSLKGLPMMAACPECGWIDPEIRHSHLAAVAALRGKRREQS